MGHVAEQTLSIANDLMITFALDMADESNTTGVLFVFRVVQPLLGGKAHRFIVPHDGVEPGESVFRHWEREGGSRPRGGWVGANGDHVGWIDGVGRQDGGPG